VRKGGRHKRGIEREGGYRGRVKECARERESCHGMKEGG
jgi:hypothetical protein